MKERHDEVPNQAVSSLSIRRYSDSSDNPDP